MKYLIIVSCLTIFMAASCKKNKAAKPKTELEKLPPITQTGANTFGCLINGKAWIPKDNYGQASFKLDADPTLGNGIFVLSALRFSANSNSTSFAFGSVVCTNAGTYNLSNSGQVFSYSNSELLCSYDINTPSVYIAGSFSITKYDLTNRIFSGTFDFTIYKEGCGDTLHFTNGRFDKKL
jgi:hypothetical protein